LIEANGSTANGLNKTKIMKIKIGQVWSVSNEYIIVIDSIDNEYAYGLDGDFVRLRYLKQGKRLGFRLISESMNSLIATHDRVAGVVRQCKHEYDHYTNAHGEIVAVCSKCMNAYY
jgi:hypothetical protein